jgi:hypothetical protein
MIFDSSLFDLATDIISNDCKNLILESAKLYFDNLLTSDNAKEIELSYIQDKNRQFRRAMQIELSKMNNQEHNHANMPPEIRKDLGPALSTSGFSFEKNIVFFAFQSTNERPSPLELENDSHQKTLRGNARNR